MSGQPEYPGTHNSVSLTKLPEGWCWTDFGSVMQVRGGCAFKSADYLEEQNGVPLIRQSELRGPVVNISLAKHLPLRFLDEFGTAYGVQHGDILVGLSGSLSSVSEYRKEGPALQNQRTGLLSISAEVIRKYILYTYLSVTTEIEKAGKGVAVQNVSPKQIESLRVRLAPLPEQRRIADAIESYQTRLDDAVATLERVQRNLERYRASVLKAAVEGRLVPTEAELAKEEDRDYEPASVLLERILEERRRRWIADAAEKGRAKAAEKARKAGKPWTAEDDSTALGQEQGKAAKKYKEPIVPDTNDLPRLPEGWCWASIDQIAQVGTGATPKKGDSRYWEGGTVPWVTSAVAGQRIVTAPSAYVTKAALAETNLRLYQPGTLVVAMYGEGKTRGCCAELRIAAATNQALAALVTTGIAGEIRRWLHGFMDFNYARIRCSAAGGVQPNLNLGIVREVAVPVPPLSEQIRAANEVERLLSVSHELAGQSAASVNRCQRLRQSILKWAFEGKLVDQDPHDEPASALLKRIITERSTMKSAKTSNSPQGRKRTAK